jgi:hypothetical protein
MNAAALKAVRCNKAGNIQCARSLLFCDQIAAKSTLMAQVSASNRSVQVCSWV